jgi:hypothetical protein
MSLTSVDLPEPLTPVTATSCPSGKLTVTSRRLCSRAPTTLSSRPGVRGRRTSGTAIDRRPGQVGAGDGVRGVEQVLTVPLTTTWPPCSPAPGADVDDPVGHADGVLVVLDDDEGVAELLEPQQRVDEPPVVALVQARCDGSSST